MSPRDEWLLMANMLLPQVYSSDDPGMDSDKFVLDLSKNIQMTRRAISMGVALAAVDGPLPVMDVIAFGGVSIYTSYIWGKFYLDYF